MAALDGFRDQLVQVVLFDGRVVVGKHKGSDNFCNLILSDCVEREYAPDRGVEMVPLGVYVVKGDNIAFVGEVDEDKDAAIDYSDIKADPLPEIKM